MTTTNPEARDLELAARPGFEVLRRKCPCEIRAHGYLGLCGACWNKDHLNPRHHVEVCTTCQGRGWLPLPEPERLGVLVRVAAKEGYFLLGVTRDHRWCATEITASFEGGPTGGEFIGVFDTPESALTAALLAATAQEVQKP